MREKQVEEYLRDKVKEIGGRAYKFISPGNNGVPDRLVCLPGGKIVFVELKAPGKTSTPLQTNQQIKLGELGFNVFADIDSKEKVDVIIDFCKGMMGQ